MKLFKRNKNSSSQKYSVIEIILISIVGLFCLMWGIIMGLGAYELQNTDVIENLNDYSLYEVPTVVYDAKGRKITEFFLFKRKLINYKDIPKSIIHSLLVAEDRKFFSHGGIDFWGIVRAMITNLKAGKIKQGGSTLTQQLAKLLFTTRKRTITRKLKEMWLTFQIEKEYTKYEILEKYLNKVYYGNNLYGIEAASRFYFGKEAKKLNYAESAFLVAIPPAPSYYNPLRYPLRTKERQSWVLKKLEKEGFISPKKRTKQFKAFWLNFQERLVKGSFYKSRLKVVNEAPYFSEYIRRLMIEKFEDRVYTGGYKVFTTLDIDKQKLALKTLQAQLKKQKEHYQKNNTKVYQYARENFSAYNPGYPRMVEFMSYAFNLPSLSFYKAELEDTVHKELIKKEVLPLINAFTLFNKSSERLMLQKQLREDQGLEMSYIPEGALVSLEVPSGRIVSMVGGSGYTPFNQLNRAYQARRQPGSSFKPMVYLSALLSRRFSAASVINDIPLAYRVKDGIWTPGNASRNYKGRIRLREALKSSVNIVSVRLIDNLGADTVVQYAANILGIEEERFRKDFSLALGTSEVTPLELAKGYAVLANQGKEVFPHSIIKVEDKYGRTIWEPEKELLARKKEQIVPAPYVYILTDMMRDVIKRGTANAAATEARFYYPAAGKTGTSSNIRDAWFSGFTPSLVTTVWIGFDKGITLGAGQYGGKVAAPVWMEFMKEALKDYPNANFKFPGGLTKIAIHPSSGLKLPKRCISELGEDKITYEYFIPGTEPSQESSKCTDDREVTQEEVNKLKLLDE